MFRSFYEYEWLIIFYLLQNYRIAHLRRGGVQWTCMLCLPWDFCSAKAQHVLTWSLPACASPQHPQGHSHLHWSTSASQEQPTKQIPTMESAWLYLQTADWEALREYTLTFWSLLDLTYKIVQNWHEHPQVKLWDPWILDHCAIWLVRGWGVPFGPMHTWSDVTMLGWWVKVEMGPPEGGARVSQTAKFPAPGLNPPTAITLELPPTYVTSTPRLLMPCTRCIVWDPCKWSYIPDMTCTLWAISSLDAGFRVHFVLLLHGGRKAVSSVPTYRLCAIINQNRNQNYDPT